MQNEKWYVRLTYLKRKKYKVPKIAEKNKYFWKVQ